MDINVILGEVKEFGAECVWKMREECLIAPDSAILVYLQTLMNEKEFEVVLKYKELMLEEFRKSAKEELEWLNS